MSKLRTFLRGLWRPERISRAAVTALVIAVVIALNAVVYALNLYIYRPSGTLDLTLSDAPDAILSEAAEAGDEVTILFCQSLDDLKAHQTGALVYETARQLAERFPELIKLEFVNVLIHPERVEPYRDEENGVYVTSTSVIFLSAGRSRVLTTLNNSVGYIDFFTLDSSGLVVAYNGEEVMTAMVSYVLAEESEKNVAYFTVGHSETASVSFSQLLNCAGYAVRTLDLHKQEVPADAALVVISNPLQDFEASAEGAHVPAELDRLQSYMERGGNVLAMLDPTLKRELYALEGFLSDYGVSMMRANNAEGVSKKAIVRDASASVSTSGLSVLGVPSEGAVAERLGERVRAHGAAQLLLPWSGALLTDATKGAVPLVEASSRATLVVDGETVDREGAYTLIAYSERRQTNGASSRLVVVPSAYYATSESMVSNAYANRNLLYALTEELTPDGQTMPYGCRTVLLSTDTLENLSYGTARRLSALLLLLPAALAVTGAVVHLRRKHR